MEDLNPRLNLVWSVKRALNGGRSVQVGIELFLHCKKKDEFYYIVNSWWSKRSELIMFDCNDKKVNGLTKHLFLLLEEGLRGRAILFELESLEAEIIEKCESEIQIYIESLPTLMLLPMLFLVFPAVMLLLVIPILEMLKL